MLFFFLLFFKTSEKVSELTSRILTNIVNIFGEECCTYHKFIYSNSIVSIFAHKQIHCHSCLHCHICRFAFRCRCTATDKRFRNICWKQAQFDEYSKYSKRSILKLKIDAFRLGIPKSHKEKQFIATQMINI